jgi:hypothetical protein
MGDNCMNAGWCPLWVASSRDRYAGDKIRVIRDGTVSIML